MKYFLGSLVLASLSLYAEEKKMQTTEESMIVPETSGRPSVNEMSEMKRMEETKQKQERSPQTGKETNKNRGRDEAKEEILDSDYSN